MRHFVIHLMQRSDLPLDGPLSGADLQAAALAVHTTMAGVVLSLVALFPLATMMVGLGLAKRFESMDIYKIASYVMALGGLVGLVNFLIALNAPQVGLVPLLTMNSVVLSITGVSLFIIGYGMYCGRSELTE